MPALNHVTFWDHDHWRRITAEDAAKLTHDNSVGVHAKFFWCSLCNHFVIFVGSSKNRIPYFKHSRGDLDKDCEERAHQYDQGLKFARDAQLPLKLVINDGAMSFYIGFYCSILKRSPAVDYGKFTIKSGRGKGLTYNFDRLIGNGIKYLWVSSIPVSCYNIIVEGTCPGTDLWARQIPGCLNGDIWFNGTTGKRLPKDADVTVGIEYFLLTDHWLGSSNDIAVSRIVLKDNGSRQLYRVKAKNFSRESATFFAEHHARLTAKPIRMFPFWPLTTKRPYNVIYQANRVLFYTEGDGVRLNVAPSRQSHLLRGQGNNFLSEITSEVDRIIVFAGRMTVLKHSLLSKGSLQKFDHKDPYVSEAVITKSDKTHLTVNRLNKRLKNDECLVTLPFDGRGDIYENDLLIDSFKIKAEVPTPKQLIWRSKLVLYIGQDIVREFQYGPPPEFSSSKGKKPFPDTIPLYDDRTIPLTTCSAKKLLPLSICDRAKLRPKVMTGIVPIKQGKYLD